mgnify:CR=1 FL=1
MKQAKISTEMRRTVPAALAEAARECGPAAAIELPDGSIETGKTSNLLGASAALLLNAVKALGNIPPRHASDIAHRYRTNPEAEG